MTANTPTEDRSWLEQMIADNAAFAARVDLDKIPVTRTPGRFAVITCMDPRVNLDCIGVPPFSGDGEGRSAVRVIRTIGGMSDDRSVVVGLFLAGIEEIAIVMHSDCGCCLAATRIPTIIDNMAARLSAERYARFRAELGEPFADRLAAWLKVFDDPRDAVRREVSAIRAATFVPETTPVHGVVYDLTTATIDVVVDGYA